MQKSKIKMKKNKNQTEQQSNNVVVWKIAK
jgi:hypothetical protein